MRSDIGLLSMFFSLVMTSLPNISLADDARVFRVADYGAKGDAKADDRQAIQKAIDASIATGRPAVVQFEKGKIYRLDQYAPAHGRLIVLNAKGLTIDGQGAMLQAHPSNRFITVYGSENVVVKNFELDYAPLPFTQGRMSAVSAQDGYIEFKPDDGYATPEIGDSTIYKDFKTSDCVFIHADGSLTHSWLRISEVTQPRQGVFRCRFYGGEKRVGDQLKPTAVNDYIAVKLFFAKGQDLNASNARNSISIVNCSVKSKSS